MYNTVQKFYDELSPDYHFIFKDWERYIQGQANILDSIIIQHRRISWRLLLDCACWIGTQSIWMAQKWYKITASDLSPNSLKRAENEAKKRHLSIEFKIADFMKLKTQIEWLFDVIVAFDSPLSHVLLDRDLVTSVEGMYSKLNKWWLLLIGTRNFDEILKEKPPGTAPNVKEEGVITFQTWDWEKNNVYTMNHFILKKSEGYKSHHKSIKLRAYQRHEISRALKKAWFIDIEWLMPEQSGYINPIVLAHK